MRTWLKAMVERVAREGEKESPDWLSGAWQEAQEAAEAADTPGSHAVDGQYDLMGLLIERIDELQALEAELPETKDAVRVVPGEDFVYHPDVRNAAGKLMGMDVEASGMAAWWRTIGDCYPVTDCYSTPEAVEAAEGGE